MFKKFCDFFYNIKNYDFYYKRRNIFFLGKDCIVSIDMDFIIIVIVIGFDWVVIMEIILIIENCDYSNKRVIFCVFISI